jgi:hypothetical protein
MARTTAASTKLSPQELPEVSEEPLEAEPSPPPAIAKSEATEQEDAAQNDPQTVDEILNSLKALLTAVEKLQKIRQEVGDIKPVLMRMLDGELVSGEDLEQLKTGVSGLLRLVRAHSDHQAALTKAQVARSLLDEVLSGTSQSVSS